MKVIIMCAATVNGKIARDQNDSLEWTSKEDKKFFAQETKKAGVIIMGHNTYKSIGHPLKERLNVVLTPQNLTAENQLGLLEFVSHTPQQVLKDLENRGFQTVFVIGGSQINSLFLGAGLVNELWLTLAPKIFGRGINLVNEAAGEKNLELFETTNLEDGFILLKYKVL